MALLALAGCGGGGSEGDERALPLAASRGNEGTAPAPAAAASTNTLQVGIRIPGHPHKVDVYRPAGATRALVFLHGDGGRAWLSAFDLGINKAKTLPAAKNVNWDWLSRNGIIAVFPQGQPTPGTTVPTWSNYVFDSGQDDVAFLKALASYVKSQYGATEVTLAGHSAGGTMTARMWCEATTAYKAFVSLAGPMPSPVYPAPGSTCTPLAAAPYQVVIGGKDSKLSYFAAGVTSPTPEQASAGLTDSILVSEWRRYLDRSQMVCGETADLGGSTPAAAGPIWNACGTRNRYAVITNADHPIASLEQYAGIRMADLIAGFAR